VQKVPQSAAPKSYATPSIRGSVPMAMRPFRSFAIIIKV
jgi:hypothetical protein